MTGLLMRVPNNESKNNNNFNKQDMKGVLRNVILERRKLAAIRQQNNYLNNFNNVNNNRDSSESDVEIDIENDDDKDDMWRPW